MGGNKLRKLEFLAADALREGADTLIAVAIAQIVLRTGADGIFQQRHAVQAQFGGDRRRRWRWGETNCASWSFSPPMRCAKGRIL
jgi:hypothetical protein